MIFINKETGKIYLFDQRSDITDLGVWLWEYKESHRVLSDNYNNYELIGWL